MSDTIVEFKEKDERERVQRIERALEIEKKKNGESAK
jgi:hypothetical protein